MAPGAPHPGPAEPPPSSAGKAVSLCGRIRPASCGSSGRGGAEPQCRRSTPHRGRQAGRTARHRSALILPRGAVTCLRRRGGRGRSGGASSRSPPPAGQFRSLQLAFRCGDADQQQPQQEQAARRRGDAAGRSAPAHRYAAVRDAGGGRKEGKGWSRSAPQPPLAGPTPPPAASGGQRRRAERATRHHAVTSREAVPGGGGWRRAGEHGAGLLRERRTRRLGGQEGGAAPRPAEVRAGVLSAVRSAVTWGQFWGEGAALRAALQLNLVQLKARGTLKHLGSTWRCCEASGKPQRCRRQQPEASRPAVLVQNGAVP